MTDRPPIVGFIGAGAVATALALGLSSVGWTVGAVSSRAGATARALAAIVPGCRALPRAQDVVDCCEVVFLTVPDDAIPAVAASLRWQPGRTAVHCSGAGTVELLRAAAEQGAGCGSLHPFQTFPRGSVTDAASALDRFRGVTFAVEGEPSALESLEAMARGLGGHPLRVKPEHRALYHASAVMSCGYLVALLRSAASLWQAMGASEERAVQAIVPIARTTLENLAAVGPQGAVTGPMVRGDVETLRAHLQALAAHAPETLPLYVSLARASLPLAVGAGLGARLSVSDLEELIAEYTAPGAAVVKDIARV